MVARSSSRLASAAPSSASSSVRPVKSACNRARKRPTAVLCLVRTRSQPTQVAPVHNVHHPVSGNCLLNCAEPAELEAGHLHAQGCALTFSHSTCSLSLLQMPLCHVLCGAAGARRRVSLQLPPREPWGLARAAGLQLLQDRDRVAAERSVGDGPCPGGSVLLQHLGSERRPGPVALHGMHSSSGQQGAVAVAILGELGRQILQPHLAQPVERLKSWQQGMLRMARTQAGKRGLSSSAVGAPSAPGSPLRTPAGALLTTLAQSRPA